MVGIHSGVAPQRSWRLPISAITRRQGLAVVPVVIAICLLEVATCAAAGDSSRAPSSLVAPGFGANPLASPPKVVVVASPAFLTLGESTNLTAIVTGGVGWLNYSWVPLPIGCSARNRSGLNCTPSEAGKFTVGVKVTDSTGKFGSNSTQLVVNSTSAAGSGNPLSPVSIYVLAGVIGVAAAVATAAVLTFFLRRRRHPVGPLLPKRPYVPPPQ